MAFKLEKTYAGRTPELNDTYLIDKDAVSLDSVLSFSATAGVLEAGATNDSFYALCVADYSFPVTDPLGPDANDRVRALVQPLAQGLPIVADVTTVHATPGTVDVGSVMDLDSALGLDANVTTNADFTVTEVLERDSNGAATVVLGYFNDVAFKY